MFFFSKVFNSKIALFYNISIFTIAFFVFFALLFNNPLDPSFSVATGKIASNVFKNPGSYISDILLQNFGLSSYLIPIFMFLRIIFHSKIKRISLASFSLIFSIILVFSAILADFSDYFSSLSYPLGGFLGMLINSLFISISKSMIMILIIKFIILKILIFALLINDILDFKSFIKAHINYEKIFKKKNNKDFDEFSDHIFFNQINNESELSLIENNNIEDKKKNKLNINFLLKLFHVLQITKNYLLIVFKKIYFLIIKLFNLIKSLFAKKPINIRDFNLNIDHYTKPNILNYEFKSNNNLASRYNLRQKKEEDFEKNNIQKEDHNINELYKSDFFKNQGLLNENNNNNQLSDEISNTEFVANDQNNKILNTINNSSKENPFFIKEKNNTLMNNDLRKYKFPEISLLKEVNSEKEKVDMNFVLDLSNKLIKVLEDFSIFGKILDYSVGPVITLFEFEPLAGTKSSRIIGLSDDIARSLSAISARISVIPGKNALGIELPNQKREVVLLKELLDCDEYQNTKMTLPITLGKDISGAPIIVDLAKMPHVLVAGTTGSGKSVAINVFILSLLYKMKPQECRFIMIDPKMLELSIYNGIPHLLTPVVTDPKKAVLVLKWVVKEMESRYKIMSYLGVRNIQNYNQKIEDAVRDNQDLFKIINLGFDKGLDKPITEKIIIEKKKFHYIVVIVDEMADLMLVSGKEIEFYIQRIAQMARAAGIHIIMATQRPSVDVITGVIKANLPTRISFSVTNKIDSRTILGEQGAEQLLGMGDMLYMPSGGKILRIHGPFVSDKTVEAVVSYLTSLYPPMYLDEISNEIESNSVNSSSNGDSFDNPYDNEDADDKDERLYKQALRIVLNEKKTSISYIQRQLRIGYNKSANLIERMEKEGILSSPNHQGKREIIELGEDNE